MEAPRCVRQTDRQICLDAAHKFKIPPPWCAATSRGHRPASRFLSSQHHAGSRSRSTAAARDMRLVAALLHSQRPAVLPRSHAWAALNTWTQEVGDGLNTAGQVQVVSPDAGKQAVAGSEGVEEEGAVVAFIVAIIICLEAMGPISLALTILNTASVIDLGLDLNAPLSTDQLAVAWMYVEAAFYVASHVVAARATVSSWSGGGFSPFAGTAKWSQQRRRVFWRRLLTTQPPSEFVSSWMYTAPTVPTAAELLLGWLRVPGGLSPAAAADAADRSYQGVPWSRLRAGDVYSWGARQLFARKSCEQLSPAEDAELRELVAELEQAAGSQLKRDEPEPQLQLAAAAYTHTPTPGVRSMCCQMDALRWRARPLAYYALSDAVVRLAYTYRVMAEMGYERRREVELPYFYRPPSTSTEAQPRDGAPREAIVFIHGIGIGPATYAAFLDNCADADTPIVAVEIEAVCQRLFPRATPTPERFATLLDDTLAGCACCPPPPPPPQQQHPHPRTHPSSAALSQCLRGHRALSVSVLQAGHRARHHCRPLPRLGLRQLCTEQGPRQATTPLLRRRAPRPHRSAAPPCDHHSRVRVSAGLGSHGRRDRLLLQEGATYTACACRVVLPVHVYVRHTPHVHVHVYCTCTTSALHLHYTCTHMHS